jgi:hypothetical protein
MMPNAFRPNYKIISVVAALCLLGFLAAIKQTAIPANTAVQPVGVDTRDFGFAAAGSGSVNKAALQAAIDAAWKRDTPGGVVRLPIAATIDAPVYVPPGIKIVCGGSGAPLTRGSVGPLFVTTDQPGRTSAGGAIVNGVKLEDCAIDNNQLAGTGFALHNAQGWQFVNTSFRNVKPGAAFTISGISAGVMSVTAVNRGTIAIGDMVMCAGCGAVTGTTSAATAAGGTILHFAAVPAGVAVGNVTSDTTNGNIPTSTPSYVTEVTATTVTLSQKATGAGVGSGDRVSFTGNTYQTVAAFGTGTGGAGSYKLSGAVTVAGSEAAFTATPWNWPGGPNGLAGCGGGATCNTAFPSADVFIAGSTFNGQWLGGYVGGSYAASGSDCAKVSAIGLLGDSVRSDGTSKPNFNTYTNLLNLCANAGLVMNNGANNTFINIDHEFDNIAEVFGMGAANAFGNIVIQPYFEGQDAHPTDVAVIFDANGFNNTIWGTGSLVGVKAQVQNKSGGNAFINPPQWALAANAPLVWNDTTSGMPDAGLSRDSPGVFDLGNGKFADKSGTLNLAAINLGGTALAAQTPFTPALSCGAGAVGAYGVQQGQYLRVGKATFVSIDVKAAIGSCSGAVAVSLPTPPNGNLSQSLHAVDATANAILIGLSKAGKLFLYAAGGGNPSGGDEFVITGAYQN